VPPSRERPTLLLPVNQATLRPTAVVGSWGSAVRDGTPTSEET
jgi:hypothetical protein